MNYLLTIGFACLLTSCVTYKKVETFVPPNKKDQIEKYKLTNYLSYNKSVIEQTPNGVENVKVMDEFYISSLSDEKVCFKGKIRTEIGVDQDLTQYKFSINGKKLYPLIESDSTGKYDYVYTGTQEVSGFKLKGGGATRAGALLGDLGFSKRETQELVYSVNERPFAFCAEALPPALITDKLNLKVELKVAPGYTVGSKYIWHFTMDK